MRLERQVIEGKVFLNVVDGALGERGFFAVSFDGQVKFYVAMEESFTEVELKKILSFFEVAKEELKSIISQQSSGGSAPSETTQSDKDTALCFRKLADFYEKKRGGGAEIAKLLIEAMCEDIDEKD